MPRRPHALRPPKETLDETTELRLEVERLRTLLAESEDRKGTSSNDMGVAARIAITRMRDTDLPELVAAVEKIPVVFRTDGYLAALAYCRVHVRSLVEAILLANPRTGDLVRTQHRVGMLLNEGFADVMMRSDRAGIRARMDLLECVTRYVFAPSVKAAFSHGQETPAGLMPPG